MERIMREEIKGIIGKVNGEEPINELDHFYTCDACGQSVDMRDLGQVFHHEEHDHERHEIN